MAIITLTTDFGLDDHYVGTMKGVILNLDPSAVIVDISHAVLSYDVLDGALTIAQAYSYFPAGSIHVVVVDPGVGTERRPIIVETGRYSFIAPDNGVLSLIYDREKDITVRHARRQYFLESVSSTFQGRDVFAPVAGHLGRGVPASEIGDVVHDIVRLSLPEPQPIGPDSLRGVVLRVDKFGNLVTNLRPEHVPALFHGLPASAVVAPAGVEKGAPRFLISVGRGEVQALRTTFAEGSPGEIFAVPGSMGFIEIVTNRGSAAEALAANKGSELVLQLRNR